jgi:uncharacterized protein (DUF433 family)
MALSATAQVSTGRAEDAARGMGTMAKGCEVELMIERTDGVCGGSARISNTRIPVWLLVAYRLIDRSDAQLLEFFPDLNQANLKEAWKYYESNQAEIEQELLENDLD